MTWGKVCGERRDDPVELARAVTFFRQIALLLPSAFLLGVLLFLVTHGRNDPGFGTYPFFQQWAGESRLAATPEARFIGQAGVFFLPTYGVTLLFAMGVGVAESALFGKRRVENRSLYRRSFGAAFSVLLLVTDGALLLAGERLAARHAPGSLVAPLLAAFAPFGAAALAVPPAVILAAGLAALKRAGGA